MKSPSMKQLFHRFWKVLPLNWQAGFYHAMSGGAWRGELEGKTDDRVTIFFVHPSLADRVEELLTQQPSRN
jgi:hypothetical protein